MCALYIGRNKEYIYSINTVSLYLKILCLPFIYSVALGATSSLAIILLRKRELVTLLNCVMAVSVRCHVL